MRPAVGYFSILLGMATFNWPVQAAVAPAYWTNTIPTLKGAYSIKRNKDQQFSTVETDYQLRFRDINQVFSFYNKYFAAEKWQRPRSVRAGHDWTHYRFAEDPHGRPKLTYTMLRGHKTMPLDARVTLVITDYTPAKLYIGKVSIRTGPRIDIRPIALLQTQIGGDAARYLKLWKQVGANPFRFDKKLLQRIARLKSPDIDMQLYTRAVSKILAQYQRFRQQYFSEIKTGK